MQNENISYRFTSDAEANSQVLPLADDHVVNMPAVCRLLKLSFYTLTKISDAIRHTYPTPASMAAYCAAIGSDVLLTLDACGSFIDLVPAPAPALVRQTTKTFRVVAISSNTNSFGLTGVVLIARDGEGFEAATSQHVTPVAKGDSVTLPVICAAAGAARYSWVSVDHRTFEIPRRLPPCPPQVLAAIYKQN